MRQTGPSPRAAGKAITDPSPPARPWQVTVAVALIGTWWVGSWLTTILFVGTGDTSETLGGAAGVALWTVPVYFLLRNTWRGGGATPYVAGLAIGLGVLYEVTGVLMLVLWLSGAGPLPLLSSLALMVVAACPVYGGRLLRSPAAKAYRESVDGDGGAGQAA